MVTSGKHNKNLNAAWCGLLIQTYKKKHDAEETEVRRLRELVRRNISTVEGVIKTAKVYRNEIELGFSKLDETKHKHLYTHGKTFLQQLINDISKLERLNHESMASKPGYNAGMVQIELAKQTFKTEISELHTMTELESYKKLMDDAMTLAKSSTDSMLQLSYRTIQHVMEFDRIGLLKAYKLKKSIKSALEREKNN